MEFLEFPNGENFNLADISDHNKSTLASKNAQVELSATVAHFKKAAGGYIHRKYRTTAAKVLKLIDAVMAPNSKKIDLKRLYGILTTGTSAKQHLNSEDRTEIFTALETIGSNLLTELEKQANKAFEEIGETDSPSSTPAPPTTLAADVGTAPFVPEKVFELRPSLERILYLRLAEYVRSPKISEILFEIGCNSCWQSYKDAKVCVSVDDKTRYLENLSAILKMSPFQRIPLDMLLDRMDVRLSTGRFSLEPEIYLQAGGEIKKEIIVATGTAQFPIDIGEGTIGAIVHIHEEFSEFKAEDNVPDNAMGEDKIFILTAGHVPFKYLSTPMQRQEHTMKRFESEVSRVIIDQEFDMAFAQANVPLDCPHSNQVALQGREIGLVQPIGNLTHLEGLTVVKIGARSGLTSGILRSISLDLKTNHAKTAFTRRQVVVQWLRKDCPFAIAGDSDSTYYCNDSSRKRWNRPEIKIT